MAKTPSLDFRKYQSEARKTDRIPADGHKRTVVPLLGLAGEVGTLLAEYKKYLRDGDAYELFPEQVAEELGDILWYVANVADQFNLDLERIAQENLEKGRARFGQNAPSTPYFFDEDCPEHEQLPREFSLTFSKGTSTLSPSVRVYIGHEAFGAEITDNAYEDDGYRFHDVFHIAYAACLGWSPVTRKLLGRKRRHDPKVDEVQDGGRAQIIEEGIAALVHAYASERKDLVGVHELDYTLLRTIRTMVAHLEVAARTPGEWQKAIFEGYSVWRMLREHQEGTVAVDLVHRRLSFAAATSTGGNSARMTARPCSARKLTR
ncbi:nucleoside triphosphate pyrophosphohydrolase family protein [Sorangium sp. So ce1182]|uniref:nucleoside triphosphate pyrophosphohydrolase family protein n=1 Tax=Sorangium sp. So ce1182 TaxID=3133334 RepID=UPI003F5DC9E1